MAAVDVDNEDLSWDESERNLEPTSSEDELLATCAVDGTLLSSVCSAFLCAKARN